MDAYQRWMLSSIGLGAIAANVGVVWGDFDFPVAFVVILAFTTVGYLVFRYRHRDRN